VEAARVTSSDTVIEVGPGEGALTVPLAKTAGRLLAIEIDPLRAEALAGTFAGLPRVRIVRGDARDQSFGQWLASEGWEGPAVLVANLPYNAATPIVQAAIEEPAAIRRAVVTVQREVAQRLSARPGDAGYGYLSVRVAAFAGATTLFDLPPGAFRPRPKVTSSVVELVPRAPGPDPDRRARALFLAALAFRTRRKTLANALSSEGGRERWERALEAIGKDSRARAEELSLEDYWKLAEIAP
jgi:16S rRNA (adenine1518-N6/adenine1519-N6)-dimethyltransferase